MEFNPHDQDIVRLLTELKDVQGEYPESMLAARRQSFLKQMKGIHVDLSGNHGTQPSSRSTAISTLLETVLIVAIVAEAGVMTYLYRDKLGNFFRDVTTQPKAEDATPAPIIPTSLKFLEISPSPAIPPAALTASPTEIIETPTSAVNPAMMSNNSSATPGIASTPAPKANNGHHYGQTPKPERTKENNGNNSKPTKDKSPKDKPTKSK